MSYLVLAISVILHGSSHLWDCLLTYVRHLERKKLTASSRSHKIWTTLKFSVAFAVQVRHLPRWPLKISFYKIKHIHPFAGTHPNYVQCHTFCCLSIGLYSVILIFQLWWQVCVLRKNLHSKVYEEYKISAPLGFQRWQQLCGAS